MPLNVSDTSISPEYPSGTTTVIVKSQQLSNGHDVRKSQHVDPVGPDGVVELVHGWHPVKAEMKSAWSSAQSFSLMDFLLGESLEWVMAWGSGSFFS
jgi:hypothetical protein